MQLILIACCGTKKPGGSPGYAPPEHLRSALEDRFFLRLMDARRELAQMLRLEPGPDLGFATPGSGIALMPAYRRYDGVVYQSSGLGQLYPKAGCQVVIISALYGLLEAGDVIREYELAMNHTIPTGRVHAWWKQHGLGELVSEYVKHAAPEFTHDLLSEEYRKALKPWPEGVDPKHVKQYAYPGLGTGSLYYRGKDLKAILETG